MLQISVWFDLYVMVDNLLQIMLIRVNNCCICLLGLCKIECMYFIYNRFKLFN